MDVLLSLFAAAVFSLACNLDTLVLSLGYALRGVHISVGGALVLAAVTTAVTWLSLALGGCAAALLPPVLPQMLGGLVLVGIGAWFLLDSLRHWGQADAQAPPAPATISAQVALAAALAVNNAGAGVAAGVSGIAPALAAGTNFAVTLLALLLGRALGRGAAGQALGRYALPLSGLLLAALGLWEALG